jgi:hypothetical protein
MLPVIRGHWFAYCRSAKVSKKAQLVKTMPLPMALASVREQPKMLGNMKTLSVTVMLIVSLACSVHTRSQAGDLSRDGDVDLPDVRVPAEQHEGISLAINEFMASNSSFTRDPQGQYSDWIEIHNYGSDAIDTSGMYLTDDLDRSMMWRLSTQVACT